MTSATKIFGLGLVAAMIAGCGGDKKITDDSGNAVVQGGGCEKIACPIGTSPKGTKSASGGAEASGNAGLTGGSVEGRTFGEGECAIECVPPRPCCEGEKWTTTSYECAKACSAENTEGPEGEAEGSEGPEGTPPEGEEGDAEGSEGTEGIEGVEGDAGTEGPEGDAEGPEGKPEGVEGDAGTEGPEGTPPDCETICAATGRECGDKPEGCPGQCGSCDKLPEPMCLDEKTSQTYPVQDVPGICGTNGKCEWKTQKDPCENYDTCGAVEPGKCGCKALTVQTACLDKQKDCGTIDNKCGGTVECGTCTAPNICGGGGTDNVCGCPVCTAPETCGGGGKPGACGAPGGTVYWAKGFGSLHPLSDDGRSIAVDGTGNIYVTGYFSGDIDLGGGPMTSDGDTDIFLAKFDNMGNHLWSKRFGGVGGEHGYAVAVDNTGAILVTGVVTSPADFGGGLLGLTENNDIFVAKFDADGKHAWSKRFGGDGDDRGYSVAVDKSGNAYVAGYFMLTVDLGGGQLTSAGQFDIFLAKFGSSGDHLWSKKFGDIVEDIGLSVAIDSAGNPVITGRFEGTVDFGGGNLTSAGSDVFLAKFNAAGEHVWSKGFGGPQQQFGHSVAVDSKDNIVLGGAIIGPVNFGCAKDVVPVGARDGFVARFSPGGECLLSFNVGGPTDDEVTGVAVDDLGNIVAVGGFSGTMGFAGYEGKAGGEFDAFMIKLDASDSVVRAVYLGGPNRDWANSVAVDSLGFTFAAGFFVGTMDIGGISLTAGGAGDANVFLAKFAP